MSPHCGLDVVVLLLVHSDTTVLGHQLKAHNIVSLAWLKFSHTFVFSESVFNIATKVAFESFVRLVIG